MRRLAFALAPLLLAACGPDYDRTDIDGLVKSLPNAEVSKQRIILSQGALVKAHIVSRNDDGEDMRTEIRSLQPNVLDVTAVVTDHDYAFLGLTPGLATVEIRADGKVVLLIDALVTEQPLP